MSEPVEEEADEPEDEEEQPLQEDTSEPENDTATEEITEGSNGTATASPTLTPEEKKVLEETVKFELNSDELTADSKEFLDKIVAILKNKNNFSVELTGYTCDLGPEKMNYELSKSRADIVSQYLVSHGIASDRLTVKAGGENNPVTENDTEESRRKNRRVEFKVIY